MKLYEYKAKWISRLGVYTPRNERERQLIDTVVTKLSYLRTINLPNLAHTLYLAQREDISEELKNIFKEMLAQIAEVGAERDV